eukprot:CAMPEP_0178973764 /NCGR_PEP_ID=MMETSP0789-20121207/21946_1 /TAXON_ID=3005 /ORGANISM="Rhizosolenia setigera, Strain CCMP 1694" /LENGTH=207 /DNA_ID=CAMNT_0020661751 /DNA_START=80 /DNA_END=703 /DNA_ORIENTATION=+
MYRAKHNKKSEDDIEMSDIFLIKNNDNNTTRSVEASGSSIAQTRQLSSKERISWLVLIFFLLFLNIHVLSRRSDFDVSEKIIQFLEERAAKKKELEAEIEDTEELLEEEEESLINALKNGEMDEKDLTISKLEEEIEATKEELQKLKTEMGVIDGAGKTLCAECRFNHDGLRTTCGDRVGYLIRRHHTPKDEAEEAVMSWDPNCIKK